MSRLPFEDAKVPESSLDTTFCFSMENTDITLARKQPFWNF